jgi:hypothetical protein
VISDIPVEVFCPKCRAERPVDSIQLMQCRVCGTPSEKVVRGREIELASLEVSDPPTDLRADRRNEVTSQESSNPTRCQS